jgi:SAM-dependent methyltransferase
MLSAMNSNASLRYSALDFPASLISVHHRRMNDLYEHNRRAWNQRARSGKRHTRSVLAKDLANPLPILDPEGWLRGNITGRRVLCLASGGGLQSALCAAAGAVVTVVDLSPEMLALDEQVAGTHGFDIKVVEASMDDLSMLPADSFEIVIQPVSTCYVADILKVYREVARVVVPGGLYISQHKQPVSLQAGLVPSNRGYVLSEPYYRMGPLPPLLEGCLHREADNLEFLHRWEEILGGLCRSGFAIEDLVEPRHADPHAEPGSFAHRSVYIAPYVKIKARRMNTSTSFPGTPKLWTP